MVVANGTGSQGDRALIWRNGTGWADLTTLATGLNLSLGTRILRYAYAVSDDGNAVVGRDSTGEAYVLYLGREPSQTSAGFVRFGAGCAGTRGTPTLAAETDSRPWMGGTFRARLTGTGPSGAAAMVLGLSRTSWGSQALPLDLGFAGMPTCRLLVSGEGSRSLAVANGSADWILPIPVAVNLAGATLYAQGVVTDPGANAAGAIVSNACTMTIGWF